MAVTCDRCGGPIDGRFVTVESHTGRAPFAFQYDEHCARRVGKMLADRAAWARGAPEAQGLEWALVERDKYRRPAVLKPVYENRILDLCRERGITRDELADGLGTSRGAVGRWLRSHVSETGSPNGISGRWIQRLVVFFDLDSRDELFRSEPSGPAPASEFVRAS